MSPLKFDEPDSVQGFQWQRRSNDIEWFQPYFSWVCWANLWAFGHSAALIQSVETQHGNNGVIMVSYGIVHGMVCLERQRAVAPRSGTTKIQKPAIQDAWWNHWESLRHNWGTSLRISPTMFNKLKLTISYKNKAHTLTTSWSNLQTSRISRHSQAKLNPFWNLKPLRFRLSLAV